MAYSFIGGKFRETDAVGLPLSGGLLYTYAAGTLTPLATYTDAGGASPNANPVVLDASGRADVFLGTSAYRMILKSSLGVTIWDEDNVVAPGASVASLVTSLASSVGSSLIGFLQAGIGAVLRTVQDRLRDRISVKDFGAKGDNVTDDYAAITAAIAALSLAGGGTLYFPPGTYLHSQTLVFANFINYKGAGMVATILKYTGTGSDGIQVNNPINSSTSALYSLEDMTLQVVNRTNGKANFADVGSAYADFLRVRFTGAAMGLILDQSEHVTVKNCILDNHSQTSAWLVNGPSHTGGAAANYTNRITFQNNQFNESSTCDCVTDDGGHVHTYFDNNFNAGRTQIRVCAADGLLIADNEMEGSATSAISMAATFSTYGGGAASGAGGPANINTNMVVTGGAFAFLFVAGCSTSLQYNSNTFHLPAGVPAPDNGPASFINTVIAGGNTNPDGGTLPFNNVGVDNTYVPVLGGATSLGLGTYSAQTGRYLLNGSDCYFELNIAWSAHTGTGQTLASLPKVGVINGPQFIPVNAVSTGIVLAAGAQLMALINYSSAPFGQTGVIQLYTSNLGTLTALPVPASGTLNISGNYRVKA